MFSGTFSADSGHSCLEKSTSPFCVLCCSLSFLAHHYCLFSSFNYTGSLAGRMHLLLYGGATCVCRSMSCMHMWKPQTRSAALDFVGSSAELSAHWLATRAGRPPQLLGLRCLLPFPGFVRVLGIHSQALLFAQQILHRLNRLPSLLPSVILDDLCAANQCASSVVKLCDIVCLLEKYTEIVCR